MTRTRRNLFRVLFLLALFVLPGAKIECEDNVIQLGGPGYGAYDNWYWAPPVYYYEPCCWFW